MKKQTNSSSTVHPVTHATSFLYCDSSPKESEAQIDQIKIFQTPFEVFAVASSLSRDLAKLRLFHLTERCIHKGDPEFRREHSNFLLHFRRHQKSEMDLDNYYGSYSGGMWAVGNSTINRRRRVGKAPSWRTAGRGYIDSSPLSKAEAKRKKRVAKYKSYERERKVKSAIKKGFRWLKRKIEKIAHRF